VGNPYRIHLLDIASHQQTPIVNHPSHHLLYAHFSPDNRWISFTERLEPNRARIVIAPFDGHEPVPESAWIPVAEVRPEDWAHWSPEGNILYFTSPRDGHFCLWGQRLDPNTHRPTGEAFAVHHLHGRLSYAQGGGSLARGRLIMVLSQKTGSIWMIPRQNQ
jgi:hypothetical protein